MISNQKIDELAQLARLEFNGNQKEAIKSDLERILVFCEKLNEVDTTEVTPLIYLSTHNHVLREDVVDQILDHDFALKNSPNADSDYFRVPKFINKKA